jgi:hypothetical protein
LIRHLATLPLIDVAFWRTSLLGRLARSETVEHRVD